MYIISGQNFGWVRLNIELIEMLKLFCLAGSLFDQRRGIGGKYCDESSKGRTWLHDFGNVAIDKENN